LSLKAAGESGVFDPALPIAAGAVEETTGRLDERRFERLPPGQDDPSLVLEQKRPFLHDVVEGHVGGEPELLAGDPPLEVIGGHLDRRLEARVIVGRFAAHTHEWLASDASETTDDH